MLKINKKYEGRIEEILVEDFSKNDDTKLTGRTRTGKLVNFPGSKDSIGKLVKVKIVKANSFSLIGEEI
ncbi:TRAM domain protein [Clostridium carboxidivorans P7]|nr:TRAM domain protein [Clostridium carboxidivorans P7]